MRYALALALVACGDPRVTPDDDAGSDVDGGMMGDPDGGMIPVSPLVDPGCIDGMYSETLPDPSADISDLVSGYSSSDVPGFVLGALARRYPIGRAITAGGHADRPCIEVFLRDPSSAEAVIGDMSTIVHECGHFYDNSLGTFASPAYAITDTLTLSCGGGASTQQGGLTFERSRIRDDAYQPMRMACGGMFGDCDFYADIYLDGDPDNAMFEGGDQGFDMLLEETVQYVNSLAAGLAFTNEHMASGFSVSERDGILTFLWYLQRYLRMARLDFPSAYEHILNGEGGCWRNAVLTVWGRAWLFLEATADMGHLGIDDAVLFDLATAPELLEEIQRLRDAEGC